MNLNSRLFDRIRVKSEPEPAPGLPRCDYPGCAQHGEFRAPMGRLREGQYFCFCLDHVRAYNQSYNYFNGMSDADVARFQREALYGHRPTWTMGVNRAAPEGDPSGYSDPLGMFRAGVHRQRADAAAREPRYGVAVMKALGTLGLDDTADADTIKARYKELVKRLHPDANGGDRSLEDRLREIIQAYKHLKAAKLV
jgi:hypothetical protein